VYRILVVCTGNICRSPMGEGILRHLLEEAGFAEQTEVRSAGTWAASGSAASANGVTAAAKHEVWIEEHRSSPLSHDLISDAALILCMEPAHVSEIVRIVPEAHDKTHLLTQYGSRDEGSPFGVEDPIGGTQEAYDTTFAELVGLMQVSMEKIRLALAGDSGEPEAN